MRFLSAVLAGILIVPAAEAQVVKDSFSEEEIEAALKNPRQYQIDPASVKIRRLGTVPSDIADPGEARGTDKDILSDIINVGSRIWKIIEKNKAVVDIKTTSANAFPKGISHWTELTGWRPPEATLYEYTAKNFWGKEVIKVRYQVHRMVGGSLNGKGHFLNYVTIEPLAVTAAYGYKLHLDAEIPSVANVGPNDDPIAAMVATIKWTVNTTLNTHEGTTVYYLQGDGEYRDVGGPFDDEVFRGKERISAALKNIKKADLFN